MDLLTHLFLPVTIAYVLRPDWFASPWPFLLAGFAVLPDGDKLVAMQGSLHSLVAIVAVAAVLFVAVRLGRRVDGIDVRTARRYALLATCLFASHVLLDFLEGGPVLLFWPVSEAGVGLRYPAQLLVGGTGGSPTDVGVANPLPEVRTTVPNRDRRSYTLVQGYGVLSTLVFLVLVGWTRVEDGRSLVDRRRE
jgi:membrane-bound metal-dependent hydrolase YbcI (DUF457 family)